MPGGRSNGRYGGGYGGRNKFQGYRGESNRGRGGRGGNRSGGRGSGSGGAHSDQHPGISFLWNLATEHPKAKVVCMAFDTASNHLYVGLDDGTVKIYVHNPDMRDRQRFQPSTPPEVHYPNCCIKSLMCHQGTVFIAMITGNRTPGTSKLYEPGSDTTIDLSGRIEDAVLCTKAPAEFPSMWVATDLGTLAVVDIKPAEQVGAQGAPPGSSVMVPKAELNGDKQAHASSITRVAEVLCSAANTSVLVSGDYDGVLAVWNIVDGSGIQKFNEGINSAVTGIVEYKGTNFLVSFFNGSVAVYQFVSQPASGNAVSPAPLATYVPASAGLHVSPAAVLALAVTYGPADGHGRGQELVDWLVVSRFETDALEVVQMDPTFKWGGTLNQTRSCHAVLPCEVSGQEGEERLVVCGSGSIVKVFRWKM